MRKVLAILLTILTVVGWNVPGSAASRVALLIGNSEYSKVGRLANPRNDARAMGEALKRLGFEVTVTRDLGAEGMRRVLLEFGDAAVGSEMAVIFYAGHGMELDKQNYLIPVDAELKTDRAVTLEAIHLDALSEAVSGASQLRLIILDSCRDNPFLPQMKVTRSTRSIGRGLAAVEPEAGTLIAFAAREGTVASDGEGKHSPFTQALLDHIEQPGLEIDFMFRKVRDSVMRATSGQQQPFRYGSLPGREIFLKPAERSEAPDVQSGPKSEAAEAWLAIENSRDVKVLEAFERRFGDTFFGEMARIRLDELRQERRNENPSGQLAEQATAALVPATPDKPIRLTSNRSWKLASTIPGGIAEYGPIALAFPKALKDVSGGKLKAEFFGPGELFGAFETFEAVSAGKVDFGWSNSAYWQGKNEAFALFSGNVPFGMTPEKLVRWLAGEGGALRDEAYGQFGIKSLSCGIVGPASGGWFRQEINSVRDVAGLKLRIAGTGSRIFGRVGGVPIALPGGEIIPALERGVIDGATFGTPSLDAAIGLPDVANFYYYPAWHQPATLFDLIVNLDAWKKFSVDERRAVERACADNLRQSLHSIPSLQSQGLDTLRKKGVKIRNFPDELLDALKSAADAHMQELAAGDPFYARVMASFEANR